MSEVLSIQAGGQIFRELHGYQKGRKGLKSSWKSASQATVGAVQGLEQFVQTMSAAPALACQIDYGPACDANIRPTGPDTINIARPKVGSIPYGEAIYDCEVNGGIALTYDDGPYTYTEDLLNLLDEYNAKATFFITGRNLGKEAINDPATPWPNLIKRMINSGHQIGSHTWSHQRLTQLSKPKFWNQMIYNEIALSDILGYFPTYMRPPYSASNTTTDAWLGELGYHITYFNLDTEGYLHDSPSLIDTSKEIWDNAVEGKDPKTTTWLDIEHDPVYQSVYNLTEYMLKSLNHNGFKTVTVGECLGDPKDNWYRMIDDQSNPTNTVDPPLSQTSLSSSTGTFPPTTDGRCGSHQGGATCLHEPDGETCCSQYGWCGSTVDHCGRGCQPIFGTCNDVPDPGLSSTGTTTSITNPTTAPISTDGRCGPKYGGTTCIEEPGATCCSQSGWCGATVDHCGTGCQPGFGTCGSSKKMKRWFPHPFYLFLLQ
ncbi:hypothetical protein BFJ63_vAg10910 [Fusarium oxysporum f. sp. narcissi]|uniref:Chitin binding protein n=1 Tax=Fusarium oxysporum f. sp. narcissi TaxID=451672 RepID=A0A4Q2VIT5_FUSOX|nr:hypothetical protein BFJ63_vAg10910 [Fusarium oxysporum f. sp. narcissi]